MKKIIYLTLAGLLLTSCGNKENENTNKVAIEEKQEEMEEKVEVPQYEDMSDTTGEEIEELEVSDFNEFYINDKKYSFPIKVEEMGELQDDKIITDNGHLEVYSNEDNVEQIISMNKPEFAKIKVLDGITFHSTLEETKDILEKDKGTDFEVSDSYINARINEEVEIELIYENNTLEKISIKNLTAEVPVEE